MAEFFDRKLQERELLLKERAEDRLLLETRVKQEEASTKARELSIRERELEIRSRELKFARFYNPWTVALVAGIFGLLGNSVIQSRNAKNQRRLEIDKYSGNQQIEEYKSEAARILEVIKTQDPAKAKINLRFLVSSGLVVTPKLRASLVEFLDSANADEVPSLPSSIQRLGISDARPAILVKSDSRMRVSCKFRSADSTYTLAEAFKSKFIEQGGASVTLLKGPVTPEISYGSSDADGNSIEGASISWRMLMTIIDNTYELDVSLKVIKTDGDTVLEVAIPDLTSSLRGLAAIFVTPGSANESFLENVKSTIALMKIKIPQCKSI